MLNCEDPPLHIGLVIDQTESVGVESYKVMMDAILNFFPLFTISKEKIHIGIITFAADPQVRVHFKDPESKSYDQLQEIITSMKENGRPTRTDKAVILAGTQLFNEANGDRP